MTVFVVTGSALHEAAAWASRVVPAKPAVPVLGGLLLVVRDDELTLTATDWETWASVTVAATVKESGRLLLSARLLTAVAKLSARDVDVVIDDSSGEVLARCGKSEWTLPALPAEDFPATPATLPTVAEVDAAAFRAAVGRVLPAVSDDRSLTQLAAVRLEPSEAGLTLVATDRYRLHVAEVPLLSGEAPEALVPSDLLAAAARHDADGALALSCQGGLFGVASDEFRLTGRQVDATFPRWRQLIPARSEHRAVVEVAELARVVDHVQVMAGPGDDDIVELTFAGDAVDATSFVADRRARAQGSCVTHGGGPGGVALRPLYLREALAALPSTHVAVTIDKMRTLLLPCDAGGAVVDGVRTLVMGRKRPVR